GTVDDRASLPRDGRGAFMGALPEPHGPGALMPSIPGVPTLIPAAPASVSRCPGSDRGHWLLQLGDPVGPGRRLGPEIKLADRAVRRVPAGHDLAVQGLPALEDGVHGAEVDPAEGGGDLGQDDVLEPAGDVTGVFESGDEAHAVFAHVVLSDRRTE